LVLAHNTLFDGAILSWLYGITPKGWLDTQCMARALHGVDGSVSLKNMAIQYGVGHKGTEVDDAKGKHLSDFTISELHQYGQYCRNDVDLTYDIFNIMMATGFPKSELKLIDLTLSMFIHPVLQLDTEALELHLADTATQKTNHLVQALQSVGHKELAVRHILGDVEAKAAVRKTLMSNPQFAEMLKGLDVIPPTKISARTGKETFSFAKTDEGFKALLEHPDSRVQALCAARLGTKSTLEETRTQRFIDISERGPFPIPLKYYAAHTGRWGGTDSVNLQNLPSRGSNAGKLKKAILAPDGYVFIDADSSQIEARTLAWEAEQDDLVGAFANGEDVYKIMAAAIYNKTVAEVQDT
jgi:DNA polymerase